MMRRNWLSLLFAIPFFHFLGMGYVEAKDHKVLILDESSNGIPYLCFKSLGTNQHILSDVEGFITLYEGQFELTDTLQVESLFFENLKFPVKEFLTKDSIMLLNRSFAMEEVAVKSSTGNLKYILETLSRNFADKYAKDYAAKMLHVRTVEANGKYREFCGYQGILTSYHFTQTPVQFFWKDKNKLYAAPLTVMRSDPWMSNKDEKLVASANYEKPGIDMRSKTALKIRYLNDPCHDPLSYKRSIEMYTPLSRRQLSNYNYIVVDEYENALNQRIIVIRFTTKSKAFPQKTMIFGTGYLYYNSDLEYAERVVMENHQDHYSMFSRWKPEGLVNSATKHIVDIAYCIQEGHIYTKSVSVDVQWVDPHIEKGFFYIKQNSRRNPLKYNLHEYEAMTFSGFVKLDKETKKKVEPLILQPAINYWMTYIAAFDQAKWENMELPGIDRTRLFKELNIKNRSLFMQAQQNGMDLSYYYTPETMTPRHKYFVTHYYKQTAEYLYPLLYHEKYR